MKGDNRQAGQCAHTIERAYRLPWFTAIQQRRKPTIDPVVATLHPVVSVSNN
jgi:hypothetical protein